MSRFISFLFLWFSFEFVAAASYYSACNLCANRASTDELANITVRLYTGETLDDYTSVVISNATNLLEKMNSTKATVFYIFGWTETPNSGSVATVLGAYLKRRDHNVVLINYEGISSRNYLYVVMSLNGVGYYVAKALNDLVAGGLDSSSLHLVGHSLGAQVLGYVAKYTNFTLPRITGLDPAGPGFDLMSDNLSSNDAQLVDIIHTDAGAYGSSLCKGTVDFYPNGGGRLQPGCPDVRQPFGDEDYCDHHKSWFYYAESLIDDENFIAIECNSYANFRQGICKGNKTVTMGYRTPKNSRGNFYLQTNRVSPFGRGKDGVNYKNPGFSLSTLLANLNPLKPN